MLGNHDFALSRDPFSQPVEIVELTHGTLLSDSAVAARRARAAASSSAGVDPRTWLDAPAARRFPTRRPTFASCSATSRPRSTGSQPGRFHLALAGHLHAGQIVIPYGFGRLLLAHPRVRHSQGLFVRGGTPLHVSPGLGTTFVPFRFFARPEATELVLRSA